MMMPKPNHSAQARATEDMALQRVAVYARVSTPHQKTVPVQIDLCRAECERRDIKPRYILKDEGLSAKTEDRPGYQRLLNLIGERRIDAVVTWKLDRLVRSMKHFVDFADLLDKAGVALISLTEQIDTSSAFGRFNFRNIASVAELERELIAERSQLGRYRMAQQCRWPNPSPPLGYALDSKHNISKDVAEAKIVQQIFSWYNRRVPLTEMSRRLAERGVRGRHGRPMSTGTIHALLRNPIYVGRPRIMDVEHARPDLRIVRDSTFAQVFARRGRRCTDEGGDARRTRAMDNVLEDYLAYLSAQDSLVNDSG